jgi:F-type H+-transporting ATPase subunit alpha
MKARSPARCASTLAQYREMAAFAQFASDLDKASQRQLARGARLVEILKQDQYVPLPVEKQVVVPWLEGFLDDLPISSLKSFEEELYKFVEQKHPDLLKEIAEKKSLSDDLKSRIDKALKAFKKKFVPAKSEESDKE